MLPRFRAMRRVCLAAGLAVLTGCVTTTPRPQQFRTFFLPPAPAPAPQPEIVDPPPALLANFFAAEAPNLTASVPPIPRPSDTEFLIRHADERFAAGKKALQEGRLEDARREFNRSIEILLGAPADAPERGRVEQRLQELVDSIYRYDTGELGASEPSGKASYDGRPLDEILNMTFPVDPSLRNKIRAQIQATTSQLPLEATDAVVTYINFFSSPRGKKILEGGMKRSGRYKAMIERVLAEEGLPQELIFLAQAESGFVPKAVSNKLCVGMWQFLKSRGQEYGLQVDATVDARMDPEKATRAAVRHLHDLYTHLGDWYLAMAAYDCGDGCIDRAVQRTGYADYWELRRLGVLPGETANYVPIILAMIIVSKNAEAYGLDEIQYDPALEYDTVELETPTQMALVAAAVDHPLSDLKELNPALLKAVAPAGYPLHLPKGSVERLEEAFAVIPAARRESWRVHRVEAGDTLASLAKRYGTSVALIQSANREELPEAGQLAAIPVAYPGPVARAAVAKAPARSQAKGPAAKGQAAKGPVATPVAKNRPAAGASAANLVKKRAVAQAPKKAPAQKTATATRPGA
jgi:membrane-bound lytic murein transglycosylase D